MARSLRSTRPIAAATLFSILLGARLAGLMSRALARVNVALKKLEHQEYVHVDMIPTGDELEDLATGFNTMVDGLKERDKLRSTFGKYMTQTVKILGVPVLSTVSAATDFADLFDQGTCFPISRYHSRQTDEPGPVDTSLSCFA